MNDPNTVVAPVISPDGRVAFDASNWDPPGGDMSLDELFPNPELTPQAPAPAQAPAPQAPVAPDFFLKAETGTVYKTKEDAVRGISEKDRTIERLKEELKAKQGPVTPQAQPQSQDDYAEDFFKRLEDAATKRDARAYANTLAEFQMAALAPYAPLLVDVAKEKAIRANEDAGDFRAFVGSSEYLETLERFPTLKNAIQFAESDPRMGHQLPEFYRLAYDSSMSRKAVEANRQLSQSIPASQPAPTPSRPTLSSSTPTPVPNRPGTGAPITGMSREELLRNPQARAEFLKRFREEKGGTLDVNWSQIGL